jgi:septum formation protein
MTSSTGNGPNLVLASESPRRHELLSSLGFRLQIDPSRTAEPEHRAGETAPAYALRAARAKARAVARRHAAGLVIGADTIVAVRSSILGKPVSKVEAEAMLRRLSGRWHDVFTGICLIDAGSGRSRSAVSRSRVHFRRMNAAEIRWLLAKGEYRDKAGAYAIQGFASLFIDRIEGCYFNIVGFPIETFARLCRDMGFPLLPVPAGRSVPSGRGH